jgi:hypothetical protein
MQHSGLVMQAPRRRELGFIYPRSFVMGVDLGQSHDPTAIAVVETEHRVRCAYDGINLEPRQAIEGTEHRVRHLERLPLKMPYPQQVAHVSGLLRAPELRDCEVVLDETGVGKAVADMFEAGGLRPHRVSITAGAEETRAGARTWRVAKILLVSRLQAALHAGELKLSPGLAELRALREELASFRMRHTVAGNAVFGAREGRHDDLVLALAIALWRANSRSRGPGFSQSKVLLCPGW